MAEIVGERTACIKGFAHHGVYVGFAQWDWGSVEGGVIAGW